MKSAVDGTMLEAQSSATAPPTASTAHAASHLHQDPLGRRWRRPWSRLRSLPKGALLWAPAAWSSGLLAAWVGLSSSGRPSKFGPGESGPLLDKLAALSLRECTVISRASR
jgi:hypothetical protein